MTCDLAYLFFESLNRLVYSLLVTADAAKSKNRGFTMSSTNSKGTVVITGASGGIGAVYADRFARRGYDLFLIARDGNRLAEVANKASGQYGVSAETLIADLTDKGSLAEAGSSTAGRQERIGTRQQCGFRRHQVPRQLQRGRT